MRLLICLYTALLIGANAALADTTAIEALRSGSLKKLSFHNVSKPLLEAEFTTAEGRVRTLSDFQGKIILLNFWATWCAPCKEEMPSLDDLQSNTKLDNLKIFPINIGQEDISKSKFSASETFKHIHV